MLRLNAQFSISDFPRERFSMQTLSPKCMLGILFFVHAYCCVFFYCDIVYIGRHLEAAEIGFIWKVCWAMVRIGSIFTSIILLFTVAVILGRNKNKILFPQERCYCMSKFVWWIFLTEFLWVWVWCRLKTTLPKTSDSFFLSRTVFLAVACILNLCLYMLVCLFGGLSWVDAKRSELKRAPAS